MHVRSPHTYMAYPLNMNHTCRPAALDLYESMAMAKVFATMKKAMSISNLCVCVCVCVCVYVQGNRPRALDTIQSRSVVYQEPHASLHRCH